jgi:hypothetical protein
VTHKGLTDQIISYCQEAKRWIDIQNKFNKIPKPTLNRKLRELTQNKYLMKYLNDQGQKVYVIGFRSLIESNEYQTGLQTQIKNNIKLVEDMRKAGFFDRKLDQIEIKKFLQNNKNQFYDIQKPVIERNEPLKLIEISILLERIGFMMGTEAELKLKFNKSISNRLL